MQSVELRRLALSLSVMEQVDISRAQLATLGEDWRLARDTTVVNRRIWDIRKLRLPVSESDDLERIRAAVPEATGFTPLMTAYLTDTIEPAELEKGHGEGVFTACKLYPANATTNSADHCK